MKKDHKAKHYVLAVVLIVVAVLLDQYTKYLAVTNLKDKPAFVLWDKVFELTYLENRGAAFGLLQNRQLFFICIAVVIFVLFCTAIYGFQRLGSICRSDSAASLSWRERRKSH